MILTTVKLFNALMAFMETEEFLNPEFSKADLRGWLDQRAIALSTKSPEDISPDEMTVYATEMDEFTSRLKAEVKPYLLAHVKRETNLFIDLVMG